MPAVFLAGRFMRVARESISDSGRDLPIASPSPHKAECPTVSPDESSSLNREIIVSCVCLSGTYARLREKGKQQNRANETTTNSHCPTMETIPIWSKKLPGRLQPQLKVADVAALDDVKAFLPWDLARQQHTTAGLWHPQTDDLPLPAPPPNR